MNFSKKISHLKLKIHKKMDSILTLALFIALFAEKRSEWQRIY